MREINHIVVHHSASPINTTLEDIEQWHRAPPNNFSTCGYHVVIEGCGEMRRGRPIGKIGAHARPHNRNSIGICLVGDNTKRESLWTPGQIKSLWTLIRVLKVLFPDASVVGHRDLPDTATVCPGLDIQELLEGGNHA